MADKNLLDIYTENPKLAGQIDDDYMVYLSTGVVDAASKVKELHKRMRRMESALFTAVLTFDVPKIMYKEQDAAIVLSAAAEGHIDQTFIEYNIDGDSDNTHAITVPSGVDANGIMWINGNDGSTDNTKRNKILLEYQEINGRKEITYAIITSALP